MENIKVKLLSQDSKIPKRCHSEDAGADIYTSESKDILPFKFELFKTDIKLFIPKNHVGYIVGRSGLGKKGITVLNSPGVIDSGYVGEIFVNLINFGENVYSVKKGDRIAQLIIQEIKLSNFIKIENFQTTERNENGHGSTGN